MAIIVVGVVVLVGVHGLVLRGFDRLGGRDFLGDEADATAAVREAMEQHLAMGLLFQEMLDEIDGE